MNNLQIRTYVISRRNHGIELFAFCCKKDPDHDMSEFLENSTFAEILEMKQRIFLPVKFDQKTPAEIEFCTQTKRGRLLRRTRRSHAKYRFAVGVDITAFSVPNH